MNEKELRESIRKEAKSLGWMFYFAWISYRSPSGFPDLTLSRDGKIFFWELKSEIGKVSDKQQAWLNVLALIPGADVRVVRPGDLENVYQALITGEWPS